MQLSIVIPCLNEIETIETCINKCFRSIDKLGIEAEVLIADNGSTDGSPDIATKMGARVLSIKKKGFLAARTES